MNPLMKRWLRPFWMTDVMWYESLLPVSRDGGPPEASLLFEPAEVLFVHNSALDVEYEEGRDWTLVDRRIVLPEGSRIPSMTLADLNPARPEAGAYQKRTDGGNALYKEQHYFHERQIAVSYLHESGAWTGPTPRFAAEELPATIGKLQRKEPVRVVVFGDSIATGYNASGFCWTEWVPAPPYQPVWGHLIAEQLRANWDSVIDLHNPSLPGTTSEWGRETAERRVAAENPDLVIIAFGMNDGTTKIPPETFKANIAAIMDTVKQANSRAEFILVSTMLPNPETVLFGLQTAYRDLLRAMTGTGVAMADITGVHEELLRHKAYADMTGNHVNHPNDYLSRWYAQFIAGQLIP